MATVVAPVPAPAAAHKRKGALAYAAYHLRRGPLTLLGLAIVLLYVGVAVFAPWMAPTPATQRDPLVLEVDYARELQEPSGPHPFGTTEGGGDIFYGVVWGARVSMLMGLSVTLVGATVGLVLGLIAGYFGGWFDELIMRVTDVFLALPLLILAMAIAVAFGRSLEFIAISLMISWWPPYTRLVRGQVLAVREMQYVEAARASGLSEWRILFRHVLPNTVSPLIVQMTMDIGVVVLVAAALSFVGFGPSGSLMAEWGSLVSKGQNYMATGQWWTVTYPGLAIFGFVLGFNLLGDGLRDMLDPRERK